MKRKIASLEDVDEKYHELYEERDGAFYLIVEDDDSDNKAKARLEEFRKNNRLLHKEKKELEAKLEEWKDIDPQEYRTLKERQATLETSDDAKLVAEGKLDEVIAKRTATMKADFERSLSAKDTALKDTSKERDTYRQRLAQLQIDGDVRTHIEKIGRPKQGAMDDILSRAHRTWKLDGDGNRVPVDSDGEPIYGNDGDIMTMSEWSAKLLQNAGHLFESGGGGGADGSGDPEKPKRKKGSVDADDAVAIGRNLKDIATGKMTVE